MRKVRGECFFAILVFLLAPVAIGALTPAEIDALLEVQEVTYGEAARFVLAAAPGGVPQESQPAFQQAMAEGWLPRSANYDDAASLAGLSLLMMKAFDLRPDGFMFRLTRGSRYAMRELRDKGLLAGRAHPSLQVSGEDFLQMLGNVIAYQGGQW